VSLITAYFSLRPRLAMSLPDGHEPLKQRAVVRILLLFPPPIHDGLQTNLFNLGQHNLSLLCFFGPLRIFFLNLVFPSPFSQGFPGAYLSVWSSSFSLKTKLSTSLLQSIFSQKIFSYLENPLLLAAAPLGRGDMISSWLGSYELR